MSTLMELLGMAGDVIDTPGSIVRGLIAGDPGRAFGGVFDPSQRVSGKEMIGMGDDTGFGAEALGFGASLATDPLMLLSGLGGLKALKGLRGAGTAAEASKVAEAPALMRALAGAEEVASGAKAVDTPALLRMIEEGQAVAPKQALNMAEHFPRPAAVPPRAKIPTPDELKELRFSLKNPPADAMESEMLSAFGAGPMTPAKLAKLDQMEAALMHARMKDRLAGGLGDMANLSASREMAARMGPLAVGGAASPALLAILMGEQA